MSVEQVADEHSLAQADHTTLLAMYQHFLEEHGRMVQGTDVVKPRVCALMDNDMRLVVARWMGELIGFVTFSMTETRSIALHVVYALRGHRRKGVASALLAEICRQHPGKRMVAEVYQRNQPALRLFTKHYFTFVTCTGWASAVREIGNPYP